MLNNYTIFFSNKSIPQMGGLLDLQHIILNVGFRKLKDLRRKKKKKKKLRYEITEEEA